MARSIELVRISYDSGAKNSSGNVNCKVTLSINFDLLMLYLQYFQFCTLLRIQRRI
jgi:hypothetical protein